MNNNNNSNNNNNNLVFYSDFKLKSLINHFGREGIIVHGVTPRVHGLTMNGNEFYCCGGFDYIIHCK